MFKWGTRDHTVTNKQVCASWSSKKRGHHLVFTKSLLKKSMKFLLHNCFFLYWRYDNDSSDWNTNRVWPSTIFCKAFVAHNEADSVKAQLKLGTINAQKINNSFQFIDHWMTTVPLRNTIKIFIQQDWECREKIITILVPFSLICTFTLKMENSILSYLTDEITLALTLYKCHFTAPISLAKCSTGELEQSFLEFLEQPVKLKIFPVLVNSC